MAKRKSNNGNTPSVSKKPKHEEHDSDSESDVADETTSSFHYSPDKLNTLMKSFQEFADSHDGTFKNVEKLVTEWAEKKVSETAEFVDITMFLSDFRSILRTALSYKNLKVSAAASAVSSYLTSDQVLKLYPDFPKRPPQVIQLHIKKNGLSKNFSEYAAYYESLKQQPKEYHDQLQQELKEIEKKYKDDLEEFMKNHPDLTSDQKKNVDNRIKNILKKFEPKTPGPKPPGSAQKRKKKEPETAFSLWAKTKADKYRDLSEEDRERKLLKKFSKLSEVEVKLLEDLALSA